MTNKPVIIVTGPDLAPQALALLDDYEVIFAGKTPQAADLVALARQHNPAGIIVRYGAIGADVMDAAPALKVISKHGTGTDTIDKAAARARGIEVAAALGNPRPPRERLSRCRCPRRRHARRAVRLSRKRHSR